MNAEHDLVNEKGKIGGVLRFMEFAIIEKPSFVAYLKSGWLVNMSLAIDFTASNKDLHDLHGHDMGANKEDEDELVNNLPEDDSETNEYEKFII